MEDTPEIPPWIPPEPPFELPREVPREHVVEAPTEAVIMCLSRIEDTGGWYFILGRTLIGTTADLEWVFQPEHSHMRKDFRGISFVRYDKPRKVKL